MPKLILAGQNQIEGSGLNQSNLIGNYRLDKVFRPTTDTTITQSWSTARQVDTIAIGGANFGSNPSIEVRVSGSTSFTTEGTATAGTSSPLWKPAYGLIYVLLMSQVKNLDRVRFTVNSGEEASWLYIGERYKTPGTGIFDQYLPSIVPGPGNRRTRTLSVTYVRLKKDQALELESIYLDHGARTPLLVIPQDDEEESWPTQAMLARFAEPAAIRPWAESGMNRFRTAQLSFEEVTA